MTQPVAVVVDPYSTGVLFAPYLRARGYRCVAVQSGTDLAASLLRSYVAEDFAEHILFDGDLARLVARLVGCGVRCVLPGNESAVVLAEALGAALGVPGNDPASTTVRRNKYEMIERITQAGLHAARQKRVTVLEEALAFTAAHGQWPVVLKPLDSASTDNVHVCHDDGQVSAAFHKIIGAPNLCGTPNRAALIQSYLDGLEYVVNSVSRDGRHYICDILESRKRTLNGSPLVYDFYRLLPPDAEVSRQLSAYIMRVLDALEIRTGGGHAEIRMTAQGPALIEIAARAMGPLGSTTTIARGTLHDQAELIVDAMTDATGFAALAGRSYQLHRHAMVLYLGNSQAGTLSELPILPHLEGLASIVDVQFVARIGQPIQPTLDLTSILAKIYLVHDDAAQLEADYATIRALETRFPPVVAAAA